MNSETFYQMLTLELEYDVKISCGKYYFPQGKLFKINFASNFQGDIFYSSFLASLDTKQQIGAKLSSASRT